MCPNNEWDKNSLSDIFFLPMFHSKNEIIVDQRVPSSKRNQVSRDKIIRSFRREDVETQSNGKTRVLRQTYKTFILNTWSIRVFFYFWYWMWKHGSVSMLSPPHQPQESFCEEETWIWFHKKLGYWRYFMSSDEDYWETENTQNIGTRCEDWGGGRGGAAI